MSFGIGFIFAGWDALVVEVVAAGRGGCRCLCPTGASNCLVPMPVATTCPAFVPFFFFDITARGSRMIGRESGDHVVKAIGLLEGLGDIERVGLTRGEGNR